MTDYQGFTHGAAEFPLALGTTTGNSLLRDADPFVYYALEYFASVLNTHMSARLLQEATAVGMTRITSAVAETLPYHPGEYLTQAHVKFPLLALYRKEGKFEYQGTRKRSVDQLELVYVLPPLTPGEHERLFPILKAVASIVDNRAEQGFDPSYTPSAPTGTAGDRVWSSTRAGADRVDVIAVNYDGGFASSPDVFMPAVVITIAATQRYEVLLTELEEFAGANVAIDHEDPATQTTEADFIEFETQAEIEVSAIVPDTGSKAGGTAVTITYAGDLGTDLPSVKIGGVPCTSVVVVNSTTITAVTGAHTVFGAALIADVEVTNSYGQTGTLSGSFTYTNP